MPGFVAAGRPQDASSKPRPWGYLGPRSARGCIPRRWWCRWASTQICLLFSGRCHAGENLKALLLQRQADRDKPLVMSDALSHNEADRQALIR